MNQSTFDVAQRWDDAPIQHKTTKLSTSDAVAAFFAMQVPSPLMRLETYMQNVAREQLWTPEQLTEIRRAILKWMEE